MDLQQDQTKQEDGNRQQEDEASWINKEKLSNKKRQEQDNDLSN